MAVGGPTELLEGIQALLFLSPIAGGVDRKVSGDLGLPDGELRSIACKLRRLWKFCTGRSASRCEQLLVSSTLLESEGIKGGIQGLQLELQLCNLLLERNQGVVYDMGSGNGIVWL